MPIAALPQNTVRAIGSTSVITDPCSIVKELLDNALDASASSVFVEISQNTLDVIQVKDNGHGIQSEDHAVVCKHAFTSKIQTVEDLRHIGRKMLGFRGEALSSAVEMSGGFTVSTRVGVESVGSSIKYGRNGELISSQRVSHPVGTTVRVTDFLKHIPVRKQTALKSAGKMLSKIKKLLQTYAICHPTKRFSLKVIKAKNESNNWMYAGGQNASLMDAALKIVGTEIASHCMIKEWPSEEDSNGYKLVALLPKEGTDLTKVNNAGQYFSVDGRPLSSGRGLTRDITKIYKRYLRSANSEYETTTINDPFLCLQIQCSSASYDVNIEPAKDDVLFEDPQRVLSLADNLFRGIYGESTGHIAKKEPSKKGKERMPNNDGFELLMARKSPIPPTTQRETTNNTPGSSSVAPSSNISRPSPRSPGLTQAEHGISHDEGNKDGQDLEGLNPWSVKKLNAPFRTPIKAQAGYSTVPLITHTARREPLQKFRGGTQNSPASSKSSAAPSPSTSNSNPNSTSTSPTDTRFSPSVQHPQTSPTVSSQNRTRRARERDRERYGNGALDTWFEKITQAELRRNEEHQSGAEDDNEEEEHSLTQLAQARFGSSDKAQSDTGSAGDLFTEDDPSETQMTPVPSTQDLESPNQHSNPTHSRKGLPIMEKWSSRLYQSSGAPHNAELEKALDFEHRKKEAVLKYREEKRNRLETSGSTNSPHHSRYLAARASLNSESNKQQIQTSLTSEASVSKPTLSPFDPRAYLIRQNDNQQQISKDGKARRIQTGKLPFENIPEGYDLHDVLLTMPLDVSVLPNSIKENLKHDLYTQSGTDFEAFVTSGSETSFDTWRYRLSDLINKTYKTGEPGAPHLDFDFSAIHHLSEPNC